MVAVRFAMVCVLLAGMSVISFSFGNSQNPTNVFGGASPCDETVTWNDCGSVKTKPACTKYYPTYAATAEGQKSNALQKATQFAYCGSADCKMQYTKWKENDSTCIPTVKQ